MNTQAQPTTPSLFNRFTPDRLDAFYLQLKRFKGLSGSKPLRKEFLLESLKELSDLYPTEISGDRHYRPIRPTIEDMVARQATLRDDADVEQQKARPSFRTELGFVRERLGLAARHLRYQSRPEVLAHAYLADGADHPALTHFPHLRALAVTAWQMDLRGDLVKELNIASHAAGDEQPSIVRDALKQYFASGSDIAQRHAPLYKQLRELYAAPTPAAIKEVAYALDWPRKHFEQGYQSMLAESYKQDWRDMEGQGTSPDPRSMSCHTLDVLHMARWAKDALRMQDLMERYDLTLSDPTKHVKDEPLTQVLERALAPRKGRERS